MVVFILTVVLGLAADLVSKSLVFETLLQDKSHQRLIGQIVQIQPELKSDQVLPVVFSKQIIPGMKFTLSTNPNVVFGWPLPRPVVTLATILTLLLVFYFFASSERQAWPVHLSLAFILAGALGNLYDRLFSHVVVPGMEHQPIQNNVRDFIDLSQLHYAYIFNIADVLLVMGVAVLVLQWAMAGRKAKAPAAEPARQAK